MQGVSLCGTLKEKSSVMEKDKGKEVDLVPGVRGYHPDTLAGMLPHKIKAGYSRPTSLETFAKEAVIVSKKSACLWFEVGAIIIVNGNIPIAWGYNGPAKKDVDPKEVGCARVVGGRLQKGAGLCRGSHAEDNAILNLTMPTIGLEDLSMMVTIHPCSDCAKSIVNKRIKKVYYLWNYSDSDAETTAYLERLGVEVEKFTSPEFEAWVELNNYKPISVK